MVTFRWMLAVVLLIAAPLAIGGETATTPPVAKRIEHRENWHGETVVDEYFWLREKANPEVLAHLEAENAYTDGMTAGVKAFEETLYREMLGRIKQTDLSTPVRRGSYYYYSRMEEGTPVLGLLPPQGKHGRAGGSAARQQRAGRGAFATSRYRA